MRVLIVEDEAKMAALIRRGLVAEGMAVDVEREGEDALARAEATEYDAIVLDLMLPGIDGLEVCARLREAGVWSPILMLTARDASPTGSPASIGRRRLPDQAVLLRRAARPVASAVSARHGPSARLSCESAICASILLAEESGGARSRSSSRRRSSRCSRPSCATRARSCRGFACSSTPGTTTTRTVPTSSTPTFAFCAARSTARSGSTRSRPCAGPATGSARTPR